MSVTGKFWMRSLGLMAAFLCLLLAFVPLYFVAVIDGVGQSSYWSTLFDLPSDLCAGRTTLSYTTILFMRYTFALAFVAGIAICAFKRFYLRWLPPLILSIFLAGFALHKIYPYLSNGTTDLRGFVLLLALSAVCCCLVLFNFLYRDA